MKVSFIERLRRLPKTLYEEWINYDTYSKVMMFFLFPLWLITYFIRDYKTVEEINNEIKEKYGKDIKDEN